MLTYEQVVEDVKEIIKDREDYVYIDPKGFSAINDRGSLDCVYFSPQTGEPSCIVGYVLARHGIKYEDVLYNNGNFIKEALAEAKVEAEKRAVIFLTNLQLQQDLGLTWGNAYDYAIKETP